MNREKKILEKIDALEKDLAELKIELRKADRAASIANKRIKRSAKERKSEQQNKRSAKEREVEQRSKQRDSVELGDYVRILNPKRGQGTEGKIVKINPKTDYVTVETAQGKVVRAQFNIQRIE